MRLSLRTKWMVVASTCAVAATLWVGISQAAQLSTSDDTTWSTATAQLFAKVAPLETGPFGTSLEGAAFDSHGNFYFVNTTAPADQPKLLSLNLATRKATGLYFDSTSMLNCIGFAPGGTMYLCDLKGQKIVSFNPATHKLSDVLTAVQNSAFVPDDIAIDQLGDMFIADYQGTPTDPAGRILLLPAKGPAVVALTGLSHPNGITMAGDGSSLWVDEDLSGVLDHIANQVSSPASTTEAPTVHRASYLSLGTNDYTDSLTVDGAGNVYLAVYGGAEVLEFNSDGIQIGRVTLPSSVPHVTHVAIQPGTRHAFVTASGPTGGYIYTFQALAAAPANTPNGG